MNRRKGGTITAVNSPPPTYTVGCAYHGFLLAWAKSLCVPEGSAGQVRVNIDTYAPACMLGLSPCATTHGLLEGGGVPTALHAESIIDGVMDGF